MSASEKVLIPPPELMNVGDGDYVEVGDIFLRHFVDLGGLKPADKVLDVGCGVGRMARPLTAFLGDKGSYEGFDIVASEIEWCQAHITTRYPRFRFEWANVYNSVYNPNGELGPVDYRFPYRDGSFTFAFATSVFTHMLPVDLERYVSEIARVLEPNGTSFCTFFLLNDVSTSLVDAGRGTLQWPFDCGIYRATSRESPEHAIAYDEAVVTALYSRYGLALEPPVHYGSWSGRSDFVSYQDIVVARKRG